MAVIERILQNRRCEVYCSFMYEAINRFKKTPEFEDHLDALFGCSDWRSGLSIADPAERKEFFYDLYERQLRRAGAKQVVRFELYERGRLIYAIFFASQDETGSDRMKAAIWKADPTGSFAFHGGKQLSLNLSSPSFEPLKEVLLKEFGDKGFVTIEAVLDFVSSDRTDYHRAQVKTHALKPLEVDGLLEADESTRRKKRTYPARTKIRFLKK
jgi:hypothetical protein